MGMCVRACVFACVHVFQFEFLNFVGVYLQLFVWRVQRGSIVIVYLNTIHEWTICTYVSVCIVPVLSIKPHTQPYQTIALVADDDIWVPGLGNGC